MRVLAITSATDAVSVLASEPGVTELVVEPTIHRGLALARERRWGMVLLDAAVHEEAATELLSRLAATQPAVALLAREWSLGAMIDALRRGAADVLPCPPSPAVLREALARCRAMGGAALHAVGARAALSPFIAESPAMLGVLRTIARIAPTTATVLLQGESGTGKECIARLLHEHNARRAGPFVAVNCAAIPEALLETELFGSERGAFTGAVARRQGRFERANGGTLFLDEIGDMGQSLQAKILRALQEREVEYVGGERPVPIDVRVVAATHTDLQAAVHERRFREDLFYRLAVVSVRLPPLRERMEDIAPLAYYYVSYFAAEHARPVRGISDETLRVLQHQAWPGNVRQFRNAIERAVLLSDGPVLLPPHLDLGDIEPPRPGAPAGSERVLPLEEVVRAHILHALALTCGRQAQAAELLGIHRNTLHRKLQEYGVEEGTEPTTEVPPRAARRQGSERAAAGPPVVPAADGRHGPAPHGHAPRDHVSPADARPLSTPGPGAHLTTPP